MAIRIIKTDSDEVLRKISKEVTLIDDRIKVLVKDMIETMNKAEGVGLAAPQIGVLRRIIVFKDGNKDCVLINPIIVASEGEQISSEACLSVPGIQGQVKRPQALTVVGLNLKGQKMIYNASDFLAVILSHEIDHLNGILYIDKIIDGKFA